MPVAPPAGDRVDYPFKTGRPEIRRGVVEKLRTAYENWRITRRERRDVQDVALTPARPVEPLSKGDLPLVFVTHNDLTILPFFLKHYRGLGVTRFICVDDVSEDGTREFLSRQSDVDLWTSPLRYGEARRGRRWREALFAHYGYDRWYINVDSDEFLVYDRCEARGIAELIDILERHGSKRLAAPMLDMYPGEGSVEPDPERGAPWQFSNCFDAGGYEARLDKRGVSLKGGPRRRRFGETNELMKYPLLFWDRSCFFGSSPHRPLPYERNFTPFFGALLHFKFFTNYRGKIAEAAAEKQHYNGSAHYQAMMGELEKSGDLDLNGAETIAFEGSAQMRALGLITSMPFAERQDRPGNEI
jgi:hypothetical protein